MDFISPQVKKLGGMRGIAAGAVTTAEIPAKGTHYEIYLYAKTAGGVALTRAQIIADIGDIILRVNGVQKLELSATQLLDIQKLYGDAEVAGNVDGVIPIFLYPRQLPSWVEKSVFAYGMADVQSFTIDVKITGVAQLSTLELWVATTDEVRPMGQHLMWRRFPQNFPTTGLNEISSLLKDDPTMAYKALHVSFTAGAIQDASVKVDGVLIHDQIPPNLNQVINEASARKFQAAYYTFAFDKVNDLNGMLKMNNVKDFRQQINWITAAPNNYNIIAEIVTGLKTVAQK